ncbi:MAG: rRNA maturation RNase YbeY [Parachlamydiaceae bacterium]|nr:rRNA maturation RNase YbeY [Parachlamydiaceae bacterium]
MNILVIQNQKKLKISDKSTQKVVKEFLTVANVHYDEVTIHFVETEIICDLHSDYFNDPSPTDCISFPMDDTEVQGYRVMGDIFVCPETAIKYVNEHGGDVYQEVTLYVIHGLLHLIGFDDIEDIENETMRAAESLHLEHLRKKNIWVGA